MDLPQVMSVPPLDPSLVAQVRRLCDAIVQSEQLGLDPAMLVESLNDSTANDFTAADVVATSKVVGTHTFACLAISPPAPRIDASCAQWAMVIDRIRGAAPTAFERAWWLELVASATDCDDAARQVLAKDGRSSAAVAAALFGDD